MNHNDLKAGLIAEFEKKYADRLNSFTKKDIIDFLSRTYDEIARAAGEVDENTSDGYHTFKELYEYRLLYNAAFFNELAGKDASQHETDMPHCWCLPRKEVYPNGNMVIIHNHYDVHKSKKHSDSQDCFGGGWFVVVAQLPTGQISNHYELKDWDLFDVPERERAVEWDGHTPQIAAQRLRDFLRTTQPTI